jgi:DNA-directed RNA polymerase specialized sigma24 family protein
MIVVHDFRQSAFREKVTEAVLEVLTRLPETRRNVFVWNHYRGYSPKEIAEIQGCSVSEVEATLDAINAILYQRIRRLLEEDPQRDSKWTCQIPKFAGLAEVDSVDPVLCHGAG